MPRLAVVISAVGSIESLEKTLVSVLENRPSDCEILVALNQPYTDPYDLRGEVRFVQAPPQETSVSGINRAIAATRAPFVHLLASGCEVTEGWTEPALQRFGDRQVGSVAALVLDAQNHERIHAAGVGYRSGGKRFLVGHGRTQLSAESQAAMVGACGSAAFYRKAALDLVGGLSSQLGAQQADADLGLSLARAGFASVLEPESRVFAGEQVEPIVGPMLQSIYNERLFWRNLPGANRSRAMAAHAATVLVEMLCSIPRPRLVTQLAGRTMALCQVGSYLGHHRKLAALGTRGVRSKTAHDNLRVDRSHSGPTMADSAKSRVHSS